MKVKKVLLIAMGIEKHCKDLIYSMKIFFLFPVV